MVNLTDYLKDQAANPKWSEAGRVHDWRNYATDEIKRIWDSFSTEQKHAIVEMLDERASNENWE